MAGEALTTNFMLSTATLMLGPQADMLDLQPSTHSLGLVKNIKIKSTPQFKELTQGIQNKVVYSVKTGSETMISGEIYEYTHRNLAYALGLNGGVNSVSAPVVTTSATATTASATTLSVTLGTGFVANHWILIADPVFTDRVYVRQVASVAANVLTLTTPLPATILPIGQIVSRVANTSIGDDSVGQLFFSAKIVGTTADDKPAAFVFPKVRITSGLDFNFVTDDFSNIPLELTIYDLVASDANFALMAGKQGFMLVN
jgi:hypothetical protein